MQTVGEIIAKRRKDKSLTQQDVADFMGMKKNTYAHKEKHSTFNRDELDRVSVYLGISEIELDDKHTKKPDSQDYRDELIESLRDQVQMLKDKLNTNLVVMEERQKAVAAMIRVTLQNVEQLRSGGDEKKAAKIQADNDKLILELAKTVK